TLSWHAIPGRTPRTTMVGPKVLPGTYTAKLTVDGRSYTQPVTVVQDPRITIPAPALAAQFRLQQRMVAGIAATYHAVTYIQQLRGALSTRMTEAGSNPAREQVATAAKALDAALAPFETGPTGLGVAHRDLGRRLNDLL